MRILLIEDEPDSARMLAKGLREQSYAVDVAPDGRDALYRVETTDYDALILDVMLPGKNGFEICRELRAAGAAVPVLMLTARDAIEARITGLDSGADDYLTKPFDFGELLARLRALIRRGARPPLPDFLHIGSIEVDTRSRQVSKDGRLVRLTTREYALFEFLARRAGEILGRAEIAEHVWDDAYDPMSNVIDVYIQRLRRKLDSGSAESVITTRRGEGYALVCPVDSSREPVGE
jgi:two-component system copper resistance phosphate regulon response regulator CusR